ATTLLHPLSPLLTRPPPTPTLFPYTTLFRSAELELGVGDDDAAAVRHVAATAVDQPRQALELGRDIGAEKLAHAVDSNVLVVAGLGLGRRTENRRVETTAFPQPGRQRFAGERARPGVLTPGGARE